MASKGPMDADKHKDNGILLAKTAVLNLLKEVVRTAEHDSELLNTVYTEISQKLGVNTATRK